MFHRWRDDRIIKIRYLLIFTVQFLYFGGANDSCSHLAGASVNWFFFHITHRPFEGLQDVFLVRARMKMIVNAIDYHAHGTGIKFASMRYTRALLRLTGPPRQVAIFTAGKWENHSTQYIYGKIVTILQYFALKHEHGKNITLSLIVTLCNGGLETRTHFPPFAPKPRYASHWNVGRPYSN